MARVPRYRASVDQPSGRELGLLRRIVAAIGAAFIHALILVFGRVVRRSSAPWLDGPVGGDYIGDRPYEEVAARENLRLVRRASSGGLLQDMSALEGPGFETSRLHPEVRAFYEQTTAYRMDVWSETFLPGSIGLWLLVTTISRKVNQLNFPLRALATAKGMDSEIVLLEEQDGKVRYAGWYRRLVESGHAIYTGFYMTVRVPRSDTPCVKVVFPMPRGNATVILRPSVDERGNLHLISRGAGFGDAGFYRITDLGDDRLRVWRVSTLHEDFHVYVDEAEVLRCDHTVRFLGTRVLHLHYRIERNRQGASEQVAGVGALA
jgi:hypothetical protein